MRIRPLNHPRSKHNSEKIFFELSQFNYENINSFYDSMDL
jgi:hypothetical protein